MDETIDRYYAYRNLLAAEEHLLELLMSPESSEAQTYLEGMLNEVRHLRDSILPEEKNKKFHCLVKHLSSAYEASIEVAKVTGTQSDKAIAGDLRTLLYDAIGKVLEKRITLCGRCGVKEEHEQHNTSTQDDSGRGKLESDEISRPGVDGGEATLSS